MVGFVLLGIAASLLLGGCTTVHQTAAPTATSTVARSLASAACTKPSPTTATGYASMFATLPVTQWGGGDVSISVKLGTREVWLYGDTLSTGRFVHSSAIVQSGGCLHVSHAGAQVLPNVGTSWYWIMSGSAYGAGGVKILAESVHRTGSGVWDFATGPSRYAIASVSAAGDVTFSRWLPGTVSTPKPTGTLLRVGVGHVEYGQVVHRAIKLADGRFLETVCQNWDDGRPHPAAAYRPLFREV